MEHTDTQDVKYVSLAFKASDYALIKKAAHRKEVSLAEFVRTTLKEAAAFYVRDEA